MNVPEDFEECEDCDCEADETENGGGIVHVVRKSAAVAAAGHIDDSIQTASIDCELDLLK